MTHTDIDDVVRIYVQKREEFEAKYLKRNMANYALPLTVKDSVGYQYGYELFIPQKKEVMAFAHLFHELGGTLFPTIFWVEKKNLPTKSEMDEKSIPKLNWRYLPSSVFFIEVAHYYLQFAGLYKFGTEFSDSGKPKIDYYEDFFSPTHYHAAEEALRLLRAHTSPMMAYPKYYDGTIAKTDQIIATMTTETGVKKVKWIGPKHPSYRQGGIINIPSLDDFVNLL